MKIAMIAVLFPLIAGIPAFGQALLPTQGVVDDAVYTVLDRPGGSLAPDVFYITLQSSDTQVAAFRVTTEFRDGRKITQTVVFRTASLGRWKDVVRVRFEAAQDREHSPNSIAP